MASNQFFMDQFHQRNRFPPALEISVSDPVLFWRFRPDRQWTGEFFGRTTDYRTNHSGFRGPEPRPSKAGGIRIAAFGDSSTFGLGVSEEERYTERLAVVLRARAGAADPEVLNFGVIGYSSYQVLRLAEQVLPALKPDFVLFYTVTNDRYELPGPPDREIPTVIAASKVINRMQRESSAIAMLRAFEQKLFSVKPLPETPAHPRAPLKDYRMMIDRLADLCRGQHARLVLLRIPNNYQTPPRFYVAKSGEGRELVIAGSALFGQGKYSEALEAFRRALTRRPDNAFAAYGVARALEALGRNAAAARAYKEAYLKWDSAMQDYLDVLSSYAGRKEVLVVDLEPDLCLDRLPKETYLDLCHPSPLGHQIVADQVAERLQQAGWLTAGRP
jgi:lysophospholipase L1-like esterase